MYCEKCEKQIDEVYGSGRFCSAKCARSFATSSNRKEISKKVSNSLTGKESSKRDIDWIGILNKEKQCLMCDKLFIVTYNFRKRKFCATKCFHDFIFSDKDPDKDSRLERAVASGKKSAKIQSHIRRSKNEILFFDMCKSKFSECLSNHEIINGWDADVVMPLKKIAIMWNGSWHYTNIVGEDTLKKVKKRDNIKLKTFREYGYRVYIVKDLGKYNPTFVKEKFDAFVTWIDSLSC